MKRIMLLIVGILSALVVAAPMVSAQSDNGGAPEDVSVTYGPEILAQFRCSPSCSLVRRNLHQLDPIAPIPGNSLDFQGLAQPEFLSFLYVGDQRVDHHFGDRRVGIGLLADKTIDYGEFSFRNPIGRIHPEPLERLGCRADGRDVFHPVCRRPSRHHDTGWITVPVRQRFAVHRESHERVLGPEPPSAAVRLQVEGERGRRQGEGEAEREDVTKLHGEAPAASREASR